MSLRSQHLVDPGLEPITRAVRFDFASGLDAVRAAAAQREVSGPIPDDVTVREEFTPGLGGAPAVRLRVTAPLVDGAPRPAILTVHGGGYVMGTAGRTADSDVVHARELGAVVVSVDYRLAPETRFPGSLEDCLAAVTWLLDAAPRWHVDPARIAVNGQSAGGGLAAALVLLLRDRGGFQFAFQHLVYPMLDDRTGTARPRSPWQGEFVWTPEDNAFAWRALLGERFGGDDVPSLAAPARATDLSGLPPAFLACGALDLFLEEDLDYAARLMASGVPTELHVYPGATHGFVGARESDPARQFTRDSMAALDRHLGASPRRR